MAVAAADIVSVGVIATSVARGRGCGNVMMMVIVREGCARFVFRRNSRRDIFRRAVLDGREA